MPKEISKSLEEAAKATDEWEYVGHTGRYVRNRIFEIMKDQSGRENRPSRIRLIVLHPANDALCGYYATYRNRSRSSEMFQVNWSTDRVKEELIITLLKTIKLHAGSNYITCEIGFRNFVSQYRSDMSNNQVTITQEDPQEPAFQYPRGSKFYEYSRRENQLIWGHLEK